MYKHGLAKIADCWRRFILIETQIEIAVTALFDLLDWSLAPFHDHFVGKTWQSLTWREVSTVFTKNRTAILAYPE